MIVLCATREGIMTTIKARITVAGAAVALLSCTRFNVFDPGAAQTGFNDAGQLSQTSPGSHGNTPTSSAPGPMGDAGLGGMSPGVGPGGAVGTGQGGSGSPPSGSAGSCNVGDTRCSPAGAAVEVCTVAGAWVTKITCPSACSSGACTGMCQSGDMSCGPNQTPQSCTPQGDWVAAASPCPYVCNGPGTCAGECMPGSKRCGGAGGLTIELCDQDGKWVPGMTCTNLCSSGSCSGSCMPGSRRCRSNQVPENCSPMGTLETAPSP